MRNFRSLKWWSVIQGVGYLGWGVGRTALNGINAYRITCSARGRDRAIEVLCSKLVEKQTLLFSQQPAIAFVLDNFGDTVNLLHQRGEHSSTRLSGTQEMAIKIHPYDDVSDDHVRCEVSYTLDQDYPSPKLMADHERDEERGIRTH